MCKDGLESSLAGCRRAMRTEIASHALRATKTAQSRIIQSRGVLYGDTPSNARPELRGAAGAQRTLFPVSSRPLLGRLRRSAGHLFLVCCLGTDGGPAHCPWASALPLRRALPPSWRTAPGPAHWPGAWTLARRLDTAQALGTAPGPAHWPGAWTPTMDWGTAQGPDAPGPAPRWCAWGRPVSRGTAGRGPGLIRGDTVWRRTTDNMGCILPSSFLV
jgi:hypothetical protein